MALLTKDAILAAQDVVREELPCPEWGGEIRVRSLSGRGREAFDAEVYQARKAGREVSIMAVLATLSVIDADDALVFDVKDAAALADKGSAPLERIYDFHRKYSGIGAATVEDAAKNS